MLPQVCVPAGGNSMTVGSSSPALHAVVLRGKKYEPWTLQPLLLNFTKVQIRNDSETQKSHHRLAKDECDHFDLLQERRSQGLGGPW